MNKAIEEACTRQFARGKLYALIVLFCLELKHGKLFSAISVLTQVIKTRHKGEIAQIGSLYLLSNSLLQSILTPLKPFNRSTISMCICPIHLNGKVQSTSLE
jgi:hypothetical protein